MKRAAGLAGFARSTPYPHDFRPKHCAGPDGDQDGCLHLHPGDERCACESVVLPQGTESRLLQVQDPRVPLNGSRPPAPFKKHTRTFCATVTAASVAAGVS